MHRLIGKIFVALLLLGGVGAYFIYSLMTQTIITEAKHQIQAFVESAKQSIDLSNVERSFTGIKKQHSSSGMDFSYFSVLDDKFVPIFTDGSISANNVLQEQLYSDCGLQIIRELKGVCVNKMKGGLLNSYFSVKDQLGRDKYVFLELNFQHLYQITHSTYYGVVALYLSVLVIIFLGVGFILRRIQTDSVNLERMLHEHSPNIEADHVSILTSLFDKVRQSNFASAESRDLLVKSINYLESSLSDQKQLVQLKEQETQDILRSKNQLLAHASHDIRSPLHALIGTTEQLIEHNTNEDNHVLLLTMYSSALGLKQQVDDLLDYNAIEYSDKTFIKELINLDEMLDEVTQTYGLMVENKDDLSVFSVIHDNVPKEIVGFKRPVKAILDNLLSNALKFTSKGFVRLGVRYTPSESSNLSGTLILSIQDTGCGLDKEQMARAFDAYSQYHREYNSINGIGLGLNMVSDFVKKLGGEIKADSNIGEGTIFTVSFGVQVNSNETKPANNKTVGIIDEDEGTLFAIKQRFKRLGYQVRELKLQNHSKSSADYLVLNVKAQKDILWFYKNVEALSAKYAEVIFFTHRIFDKRTLPNNVLRCPIHVSSKTILEHMGRSINARDGASKPLLGVRILSIDDMQRNTQLIEMQLQNSGAIIHSYNNPLLALEKAKAIAYDIILTDIVMPKLRGDELVRLIRDGSENQATPIIAATATVSRVERDAFMEAGVDDVLIKPFTKKVLLSAIQKNLPDSVLQRVFDDQSISISDNPLKKALIRIDGLGNLNNSQEYIKEIERLWVVLTTLNLDNLADELGEILKRLKLAHYDEIESLSIAMTRSKEFTQNLQNDLDT